MPRKLKLRLVNKDLFVGNQLAIASCGERTKKSEILIRVDSRQSFPVQVFCVLHELVHLLFIFLQIPDKYDDLLDRFSDWIY